MQQLVTHRCPDRNPFRRELRALVPGRPFAEFHFSFFHHRKTLRSTGDSLMKVPFLRASLYLPDILKIPSRRVLPFLDMFEFHSAHFSESESSLRQEFRWDIGMPEILLLAREFLAAFL